MDEYLRTERSEREMSTAPQRGMPGYEGYLNERVVTLPEMLRDDGYLTLMAGKWHLGLTPSKSPQAYGFEHSFAHLPACSNHYGYEPQLQGQDKTPGFMTMSFIALHSEDGEYVRNLPEGWHSSDGYGDKMLSYLQDRTQSKDERPFFAYFPFMAPHWPLQAPPEYVAHYKGVYDDGPDALRLMRLQRLKDLGMISRDVEPHPVVADEVNEWKDVTLEEKANSCKSMEVFAGMVECIDANVGKVVSYLEESGELDNTFVCFLSDNCAEGAAYEAYPIVQGHMMQHLQKYYNNSIDNLGNGDSFIWYGPRWAQAATAPSSLYKAYTTEGGVHAPFLAKFPEGVSPKANVISGEFATVMDIAPTILEMAGVKHPAPRYQGREVVEMRGKSMFPYIQGKATSVH
jgi:arylsulfatase A-like enzyme